MLRTSKFIVYWIFFIYLQTLPLVVLSSKQNCSFTIVTFLPIHTNGYLDSRLLGPGLEIAQEEVGNTTLQDCDIKWITPKTQEQTSCDLIEANTADRISQYYYSFLNTSHPLIAVVGAACSYATRQLAALATSKFFFLLD
jgi:hypothetical protein